MFVTCTLIKYLKERERERGKQIKCKNNINFIIFFLINGKYLTNFIFNILFLFITFNEKIFFYKFQKRKLIK